MIENLSYNEFCNKYYMDACKAADSALVNIIKQHGAPHTSIDVDLVKDLAVTFALRKAYENYDSKKEGKSSVKTYLSKIVHNRVLTEFQKEAKGVGAGDRRSLDEDFNEGGEYDGTFAEEDGTEQMNRLAKMLKCIDSLGEEEQVVIRCWLANSRTYTDDALKKLGWGFERRSDVQSLKSKAMSELRKMMKKDKPRSEYKEKSIAHKPARVIYAASYFLRDLIPYVDLVKKYFGLNHPNLELEILLLDRDPDRKFELIEYVTDEELKKAYDEAHFNESENWRDYLNVLALVTNLYYKDSYQQYEDFSTEEIGDDLRWECIKKDIVKFYVFMQEHSSESPITIKIGNDKVELSDEFGWVQGLVNYHLFPKCLPDIKSKEEALAMLKKSPGRRAGSTIIPAIINGIATYFEDMGLIAGRAPKNLCSFIRKILIMMELVSAEDESFTEGNIKASINNYKKQKKDPKVFTPEVRTITFEELGSISSNPDVTWLFKYEE